MRDPSMYVFLILHLLYQKKQDCHVVFDLLQQGSSSNMFEKLSLRLLAHLGRAKLRSTQHAVEVPEVVTCICWKVMEICKRKSKL